jgi:hypothetical protein
MMYLRFISGGYSLEMDLESSVKNPNPKILSREHRWYMKGEHI